MAPSYASLHPIGSHLDVPDQVFQLADFAELICNELPRKVGVHFHMSSTDLDL